MEVYVVTSGMYSDYGIDHLFSTKEKAEEYIRLSKEYGSYNDFNDVEKYELDPEIKLPHNHKFKYFYYVEMDKEGNVSSVSKSGLNILDPDGETESLHFTTRTDYEQPNYPEYVRLSGTINADNEEHAIKIMGEKRMALLRQERWIDSVEILKERKLFYKQITV